MFTYQKIIICSLFLVFSGLFTTMATAATGPNGAATSITDPQKAIIVKKSQPVFAVILSSNPTTGFLWSLKSLDSNLIKPIRRDYSPAAKGGLVGKGGSEKWLFAVKPAGFVVPQTTSITLIYSRLSDLEGAQVTNFKVVTQNDD